MATTYVLISSQVLGANATTITFSSIPQTYTDLVLKASVRTDFPAVNDYSSIRINGLSTAIYSTTTLFGVSGNAASNGNSNSTALSRYLVANGSTSTANTFSSNEVYFPNYTSSASKQLSNFSVDETNATNGVYVATEAFLISSTAAITSITFYNGGGNNMVPNSSFYLYGIKNS